MNRQADLGYDKTAVGVEKPRAKMLSFTGMFAAIIFLATWALHVPAGVGGGYVHFGDAFVYLAACFLPTPFAMAAGAVGAGLADFATPGAALWILPTVIIKPLCCLPFLKKGEKLLRRGNIIAALAAGLITAAGYGAATAVMTGSAAAAVAELPLSFIQAGGSAACFIALAAALDKTGVKSMMRRDGQ